MVAPPQVGNRLKKPERPAPSGMFEKILRTVRRIPRGKVATYGDVAASSGYPRAARQVVWALRTSTRVPWHRVLGARGTILLKGENGFEQRFRLQAEGVVIAGDRVDLNRYGHKFRMSAFPCE